MSERYKFDRTITLGNILQVFVMTFAGVAFFYGLKGTVDNNTRHIEHNARMIEEMRHDVASVDVIKTEIRHLDEQLDRIERKLDE